MALVALVPLVVSHLILIGINRDSLETLEKKYLTRSAVQISNDLQNLLVSNRQQLTKIASSILMMRKALPPASDPFTYAAQSRWVADAITADGDLIAIRALNAQGQGAEAVPTQLDKAIVDEMAIAQKVALAGNESTGRVLHISARNEPVIVMAVPVREGETTVGTVVGLVSLRRIVNVIREEGKGDVTAFLVDRDGRVLIHSEPSVDVQHPNFSNLKLVKEFANAKVPLRLTESYVSDNTKVLGTIAPASSNVSVIVHKPEQRAFASVDQMIRATTLWVAVALLLAILAAVLFASGIAHPIRLLAQRTREIAQGNYQQRVELKTKNEIGELAGTFNVMSESIERAVDQLKKAAHENHLLFLNSVRMLAAAIDAKDPYTRGHSERVARYSIGIGKNLNLPEKEMRNLRISALLHDVGKIGIDDNILKKPAALTDEEYAIMKQHPQKGYKIMSQIPAMRDFLPGMYMHHEMMDGRGYPQGLKGDQIPMQARIVSVADTFDAMTTDRPYQKGMSLDEALSLIKTFVGTRYDEQVVTALVEACEQGQIAAGRVKLSKRAKDLMAGRAPAPRETEAAPAA